MVAGLWQVVNMRDMPVREHHVTANFPLEILKDSDVRPPCPLLSFPSFLAWFVLAEGLVGWVQVGHTAYNGVTRQIPGTQSLDTRNGNPIPSEADEPLWMKMSTAVRKCLR